MVFGVPEHAVFCVFFYSFMFFLCFFYVFFYFLFFFVNLYPPATTKCCIPPLPPDVVSHCTATKCRNWDKKKWFSKVGGGIKNEFRWFYTPLKQLQWSWNIFTFKNSTFLTVPFIYWVKGVIISGHCINRVKIWCSF